MKNRGENPSKKLYSLYRPGNQTYTQESYVLLWKSWSQRRPAAHRQERNFCVSSKICRFRFRKKCLRVIKTVWSMRTWRQINQNVSTPKFNIRAHLKRYTDKNSEYNYRTRSATNKWKVMKKVAFLSRHGLIQRTLGDFKIWQHLSEELSVILALLCLFLKHSLFVISLMSTIVWQSTIIN